MSFEWGGPAFTRFFWTRVASLLDVPNDCFHFSLVCKLFEEIFSKESDERKKQFAKTVKQWVHPNIEYDYLDGDNAIILPDGTLHGNGYLMGKYFFGDKKVVGYVFVSFSNGKTVWRSLIKNWGLSFLICQECGRRHTIWRQHLYNASQKKSRVKDSMRCSIVKYACKLKNMQFPE